MSFNSVDHSTHAISTIHPVFNPPIQNTNTGLTQPNDSLYPTDSFEFSRSDINTNKNPVGANNGHESNTGPTDQMQLMFDIMNKMMDLMNLLSSMMMNLFTGNPSGNSSSNTQPFSPSNTMSGMPGEIAPLPGGGSSGAQPSALSPNNYAGASPSSGISTQPSSSGIAYTLPGLDEHKTNSLFRHIAITAGSEPGEFGHKKGLNDDQKKAALEHLPGVIAQASMDRGGQGIIAGDGKMDAREAYAAKALSAVLYRPHFNIPNDDHLKNWEEGLDKVIQHYGGIPEDAVAMIMERTADGRALPITPNGSTEVFGGMGSEFTPMMLRQDFKAGHADKLF